MHHPRLVDGSISAASTWTSSSGNGVQAPLARRSRVCSASNAALSTCCATRWACLYGKHRR
ncbi:DUF3678 domain-containing protein [Streptomyces sp. SID4915]|nr:DUF3678 domain-containing protein [Streptomyces sp. SID4915]